MLEITAERLRDALAYDPETGWFTWKIKASKNTIVGRRAGTEFDQVGNKRRRKIRIDGKQYLEHRLVWLYVHGRWPDGVIDHINGDARDNWLSNLRECSQAQNCWNTVRPRQNLTGYAGVSERKGRFYARVRVGKERAFLGGFPSACEAAEAYLFGVLEHHGDFAGLQHD